MMMVVVVVVVVPALMRRGRCGRERAENERQTDGAANQKPLHSFLLLM